MIKTIPCDKLVVRVDRKSMDEFRDKLKKDRITMTHFVLAMVYAYLNEDFRLVGRPANMRMGRLFHYKGHEEPNDVLGVKFATARENILINPSTITIDLEQGNDATK